MIARLVFFGSALVLTSSALALEVIPDNQWKTAPNVVAFQRFSQALGPVTTSSGTVVSLVNLNSNVNAWYLLEVQTPGRAAMVFNLENPAPLVQSLTLSTDGQLLLNSKGSTATCDLLAKDGVMAATGKDPYMPLCSGRLFLRNRADGRKDTISWITTGLRDVFGDYGDSAVNFVKEKVYDGKFFEAGTEAKATDTQNIDEGGPEAALVSDQILISNHGIGFELKNNTSKGLKVGQWYKAANFEGVFVSVMKAKYVAGPILKTFTDRVRPIESGGQGEGEALVDSVAMDLSRYSFGWNNGTEHPGVGWSPRARNNKTGAGPDGFGTLSPLTFPGVVNPIQAAQTVGVLTGGFQRMHSAFKAGPLTGVNRSHHYGFMEKGVVMSTIVPNLATFIINIDGSIELKTWTVADNERLAKIRDIRQNGVPILETDPTSGQGVPSTLVNSWVGGNWSGSAEIQLKTPRTSACIAERGGKRFLILSYFTTHTPSAMARVLQSYGCKYAIHLDMNHPRFAYTAFFTASKDGDFKIEHLSNSMTDDVKVNGKTAPRSLLTPTYKDFFYVMKR